MASLKPRAAYTESAEGRHCVYREAAQASPLKAAAPAAITTDADAVQNAREDNR